MITLNNKRGLKAQFNKKGASLESLYHGSRCIAKDGFTVGRFANRIAHGRFCIGDNMYQLSLNENGNTNHGGINGLMYREWKAELYDEFGIITNDESCASSVKFSIKSVDGDQGFPGNLNLSVTYELTRENEIIINYEAVSDKDTVVNFTNHSFFNLNGSGKADNHELFIDADYYTEVDENLIPTGNFIPTNNSFYDYTENRKFKGNIDINFVLNGEGLRHVATLKGIESKLKVMVYTDQPGLQVYNDEKTITLETQHFPDSPNHDNFPSTLLHAGELFKSTTIYKICKH